ncbi:ABC-2 type transport system permease protein [Hamadaea flava]|uniref:ABC transporter permease n=1 Tax=Hamadaea flava TaxID=1742688 RepID=A0ABV8LYE3_9ACTN|nr:ABC transporter permease subunit [Hamadaea flava]MCP2324562.1 ABC-2 type transport system permease protein [Hamadaea flava]
MNLTIASITLRGLLGRARFLWLLPLPLVMLGLAWLADALGAAPEDWTGPIVGGLGIAVVLPVMALIVGTGVLGSEIDDGTVVHILTKPLPRREIILAKLAVATGVTALVAGVPLFLVGLMSDGVRLGLGLFVAAIAGSLAYCALFLALSLLTRRPVLVGLAYVLLWEGLLGNLLKGTRLLSVQQNVVALADAISGSDLVKGTISTPFAIGALAVFAIGGTWLAVDRLRSFSVAGETS